MLSLLIKVSPIILNLLLAIYFKRSKLLPENTNEVLATILFKLIAPILVFASISRAEFSGDNLKMLIAAVIIVISLLIIVTVSLKLFKVQSTELGALLYAFSGYAIATFAYPFAIQIKNNELFENIVLIDSILFPIAVLIIFPYISLIAHKENKETPKTIFSKIIKNYVFIAALLAIIVNFANIQLSNTFYDNSKYFTNSFAFLATFFVGLQIGNIEFKKVISGIFFFVSRLTIIYVLILGLTILLDLGIEQRNTLFIIFASPIAPFMIGMAKSEGYDTKHISQYFFVSIFISFLTYLILASILNLN